jgi:hypothetical protein
VIPPSYRRAEWRIVGVTPYLMGADRARDPFDEQARVFQGLTLEKASARSVDKHMQIAHLDWELRMYFDDEFGPYVPGDNPKTALAESATFAKKGETVRKHLSVLEAKLPLEYDGPRDLESLWDEGYRDMRQVVNAGRNGGRVPRCRPCFEEWALTVSVAYNPSELSADVLAQAGELAQVRGLGDGRRIGFGQFVSEWRELS